MFVWRDGGGRGNSGEEENDMKKQEKKMRDTGNRAGVQ